MSSGFLPPPNQGTAPPTCPQQQAIPCIPKLLAHKKEKHLVKSPLDPGGGQAPKTSRALPAAQHSEWAAVTQLSPDMLVGQCCNISFLAASGGARSGRALAGEVELEAVDAATRLGRSSTVPFLRPRLGTRH
jgi:hypothetical protein